MYLRQEHHYWPAALVSLFLHALGAWLLIAKILSWHWPVSKQVSSDHSTAPILTLFQIDSPDLSSPKTKSFLNTERMPELEKPLEQTRFESDRNTALTSLEKSAENLSPKLDGVKKPELNIFETPQQLSSQPQSASSVSSSDSHPRITNPSQGQNSEMEKVKAEEMTDPDGVLAKNQNEVPKALPVEKAVEAKAATAGGTVSFRQEKSALEGGVISLGETSIESTATPLGKYKARIYQTIGSQWRFMVGKQSSVLTYGTVSIRFVVLSDGSLEDVSVRYKTPGGEVLESLSASSIRLCAPFQPFPSNLKQQLGNRLPLDVNFIIY